MLPPDETVADTTQSPDSPTVEQATDEAGTVQQQINWDVEDNPYRQRYTGLQGNFKQVQQQMEDRDMAIAQLAEELAVTQAQLNGTTQDQVPQLRQSIRNQIQERIGADAQSKQMQALMSAMAPMAKQMIVQDLAKKYGVDPTALSSAPTPEAAEVLAKHISTTTRKQTLEERKQSGVDHMEQGGGGRINYDSMTPNQLISLGVAQEHRKRPR